MTKAALLVLLAGCATPTEPYLRYHPTSRITNSWFADGPPMFFVVRNPLNVTIQSVVTCPQLSGDGYWISTVPPHGEAWGLGQVMNKDVHADVCTLKWSIK